MLYKKIHRQFLRQFRKGRKFKIIHELTGNEEVQKIIRLYIEYDFIFAEDSVSKWYLIPITGRSSGQFLGRSNITWLD